VQKKTLILTIIIIIIIIIIITIIIIIKIIIIIIMIINMAYYWGWMKCSELTYIVVSRFCGHSFSSVRQDFARCRCRLGGSGSCISFTIQQAAL